MAESRGKYQGYPFWQWKRSGKRKKSKKDTPTSFTESLCPTQEDVNIEGSSQSAKIWKEPVNDGVALSAQQEYVLNLVRQGKNVFYTGNAGTGKTTLLGKIRKCAPDDTFVTALTGVAAVQAGGTTLHSFAGIGLGNGSKEYLCNIVQRGTKAKNWKKAKVLIIDEISMLDGRLFDKLEYIARKVRNNDLPFGGVQLVVCGDFFQLPPIPKVGETSVNYCFQSTAWNKCIDHSLELTQIYRQSDPNLIKLLNEVRYQCLSDESLQLLTYLNRPLPNTSDIEPTKLYSHNARVNDINNAKLLCLPGEEMTYTAEDHGRSPYVENMSKYVIAMDKLVLKIGSQVMLLKNLTEELINGSRGVVEEFDDDGWPRVKFVEGGLRTIKEEDWSLENSSGTVLAVRTQVPLKLAWAITIHKSQGMSIDFLQVDLKNVFSQGQGYVALSRARTLEGLQVLSFDETKFTTSDAVIRFYQDQVEEAPIPTDCKLAQDINHIYSLTPSRRSEYALRTPSKRKRTSNEGDMVCTTTKKRSPSEHVTQKSVDKQLQSPLQKRPVRSSRKTSMVGKKNVNNRRQDSAMNQKGTPQALQTSLPFTTASQSKGFQKASVVYQQDESNQNYTEVGKSLNNKRQDEAIRQVGDSQASVVYQHNESNQNYTEKLSDSKCLTTVKDNKFLSNACHLSICSNIATTSQLDTTEDMSAGNFFDGNISDSECLRASQEKRDTCKSALMMYTDDLSDSQCLTASQSCVTGRKDSVSLKAGHEKESECFWNLHEDLPDLKSLKTEGHSSENINEDVSTVQQGTPLAVKRKRSTLTPSSIIEKDCQPYNTTPTNTPLRKSLGMTHLNKNDSSRKCTKETTNASTVDKKYRRLRQRSKKKCSILFDKLKNESPGTEQLDNDVDTFHDAKGNDTCQLNVECLPSDQEVNKPVIEEPSTTIDIEKSKDKSKHRCSQLFESLKEDIHTPRLRIAYNEDGIPTHDKVDHQRFSNHKTNSCKSSPKLTRSKQDIRRKKKDYNQDSNQYRQYKYQYCTTDRQQQQHNNVVAAIDVSTQTEHFSNHTYQGLVLDYHLLNVPLVVAESLLKTCGFMLELAIILYHIVIQRYCEEYYYFTSGGN